MGSISLGLGPVVSGSSGWSGEKAMPRRRLGKTGEKISVIGFGGIMLNDNPQDFANNLVAEAFDKGVNYYDISPLYGNAEEKMGPALKPYRSKCFLACKTQERKAAEAEKQLHKSLEIFGTDYFDLYQLHALHSVDEVKQALGRGGAMESIVKARKEGKIRFIGFSAHTVEAALLALDSFDFDTVLFPFNFACWQSGNFGPQVYEKARSKEMGLLALKAMALTRLREGESKVFKNVWYRPIQDDGIMQLALRYTLSLDITAAIPPGEASIFRKAIDFAADFKPLTGEEKEKMAVLAGETEPLFPLGA
jgi:predicted aldo/keto reductase-like oxidoreductase